MQFSWRLRCLAAPSLVGGTDQGRVLSLSRKDAALLAYVALNGAVPSAAAAGLLWPQSDERGAMNNLRQRLHRLRRDSGARLLEVTATARLADDLVLDERPAYSALEADPAAWDDELLGSFRYDDASEFSAWLAQQRKAWADARVEALAGIASEAERQGQLARALVYAQRLGAHEPLSEHAHRRLMRLHYLRGDTASAVAAFEACERALKDELGLRPSAETLELLQTIERSTLPAPTGAIPTPASLLRPPRAVGRDSERARLIAAHREGCIAALVGEAGMGKTRLLQDFIAAHPHAVYAQARPGDGAVPYGALARLLRAVGAAVPSALAKVARTELARVVPELADADMPVIAVQTNRLQRAVEDLLLLAASDVDGLTLVLDDLHFADRASIEMLCALVDAEALISLRWVFAHRPVAASDPDEALLHSLADAPRARWIVLSPLTDADLVELLTSLALPGIDAVSFAPTLAQHTGGNPLYVLETLRAVRAPAEGRQALTVAALPRPENIAHMIDRRLQRLSDGALALGRVAALAGPDFSTELAEHALATPALLLAGAWAELEAADVLRDNSFAHDLVRDGMLRATPQAIAGHAHRLIAQFLAQRGAEPARLAPHWLAGGDAAQAALAYREAARRALAAGRPREQASLLESCAQALDQAGDPAAAFRVRSEAVGPLLQSDGVEAAIALTDRLLAQAPLPALAAHAWSSRAMALMWAGRVPEAEQAAQNALAQASAEDDSVRVNAVCMLAAVRGMQGDPPAALALLRPWVGRIDQVADPETRVNFFGNLSSMLMQADRSAEALPAAQRHLQLARQIQHSGEQVTALMNLSNLHGRRGELAQAVAHGEAADLLIPESGQSESLLGWNRSTLGYWLCGAGRFAEGIALLEASIEEFSRPGGNPMLLSMVQDLCAPVWLTLGQVGRAHQLVAAPASAPAGRVRARQLAIRARVRRAMGHDPTELFNEVLSMVSATDPVRLSVEMDQAFRGSDVQRAERLAVLERRAQEHEYFPLAAMAAAWRISALMDSGHLDGLATLVPEAERAALLSRGPHVYLPELLQHCAAGYRALGREDDARRCLSAALDWVHAVALPHVPAPFVDGFLQRNPVNVQLRVEAARQALSSTNTGA